MGGTFYINHNNFIILIKASIVNSMSNYNSGFLHAQFQNKLLITNSEFINITAINDGGY